MNHRSFEELKDTIRYGFRVVGIDGHLGSGKTTLSRALHSELGVPCIHLDDYLERGRGSYSEALRVGQLKSDLAELRHGYVVEGVCLLDVANRIGLELDFHVFVDSTYEIPSSTKRTQLYFEVERYLRDYRAAESADMRFTMLNPIRQTNQLDVDIAYLKYKTIVCSLLAFGGMISVVVGAFVLIHGLQGEATTVIRIMGAEVTARGIGAVIMSTSVMWAYFAYLARPKYSSRSETRTSKKPDGSSDRYEFRSSTAQVLSPNYGDRDGDTVRAAQDR